MLVALLASGGSALTLHAAAPSAARAFVFGGVSRCAVARMDLVRQVNTLCTGVSPAAPTLPPACVRRHLRSLVRQVNTAEFEEEIQDCSTPIILDVFASWCGPCQMMAPEMTAVAEHYGDRLRVLKVDSDEEEEVATALQARALPPVTPSLAPPRTLAPRFAVCLR